MATESSGFVLGKTEKAGEDSFKERRWVSLHCTYPTLLIPA